MLFMSNKQKTVTVYENPSICNSISKSIYPKQMDLGMTQEPGTAAKKIPKSNVAASSVSYDDGV